MRLINTSTLKLSEFYDDETPTYAVLSHTWGDEEISYQEWREEEATHKAGCRKVRDFCRICCEDGFACAWADTCCIDKTSSAELSEAINSMYRWYKRRVCYAYLADVPRDDDIAAEGSAFSRSRWFIRGWTLQELIAPREVNFYSEGWVRIAGRRTDLALVAKITGIPIRLLDNPNLLSLFSIAQKMSWTSKRKTTRREDTAYCLMGLFEVDMPLLYGEGNKAFFRLQEEIMKFSADHTLFAWSLPIAVEFSLDSVGGLLAPSPECFSRSSQFVGQGIWPGQSSKPYSMTNRGLEIELLLSQTKESNEGRLAILDCQTEEFPSKAVAILLDSAQMSNYFNTRDRTQHVSAYERVIRSRIYLLDDFCEALSLETIYIQRGGGE